MKVKFRSIATGVFALFLIIGGASFAHAQQRNVSRTDKNFVQKAARDGMLEVALAKDAASKSNNPAVKDFSQQMIQDHTNANQQLQQIAQSEGVTVPNSMGRKDERKLQKFSKMSEPQFDRAYMDYQVKDHQRDIKAFEKEAKDGKNPELKSFASQMVPKLQHHLSMASSADKTVSGRG